MLIERQFRRGWDPASTGIQTFDAVNDLVLELVVDLQRVQFADTYRRANLAVPASASWRRHAIRLARIAIEAYEQADLRAETLRGELRRLSDRGLQASLGKTWGEIGALFMWLPGSRLQQILYRPPLVLLRRTAFRPPRRRHGTTGSAVHRVCDSGEARSSGRRPCQGIYRPLNSSPRIGG